MKVKTTLLQRIAFGLFAGLALLPAAGAAEVAATLDWGRRVELGTPVSGVVAEVPVRVGDAVVRDQVLVRLDARRFQAEVSGAEARVRELELARGEAELELERAEELYARTVISAHEREQARIDFAAVDARYRAALAARTRARLDLEDSAVHAPFAGVVVRRAAEPGQAVVSRLESRPLVVLVDAQRMLARARLTLEQLAAMDTDAEAAVEVAGERFAARLHETGLEPVEYDGGPLYAVAFEFDTGGAAGRLRAGQPAKVLLP